MSKGGEDAQSSSSLESANAWRCASDLAAVTSLLLCCVACNLLEGRLEICNEFFFAVAEMDPGGLHGLPVSTT